MSPHLSVVGMTGAGFQPFLRFYEQWKMKFKEAALYWFQPFLRFYRSCWAVFWIFKFFWSFLEPRRPP